MIDTRLKQIALILLDVDGVLTTGQVIYNDSGQETKVFYVRDGLGIRMLIEAGLMVGIVTGRRSMALVHRCRNLGINLLKDGIRDGLCGRRPAGFAHHAPGGRAYRGRRCPRSGKTGCRIDHSGNGWLWCGT